MLKFAAILLMALATATSLDSMSREILLQGLHRELVTNVTFTPSPDQSHCSFIVRENITKDHYIYTEEVTRDMPHFDSWQAKIQNIEAPTSVSADE